ncbi:MAG: type VI secretion system tip protein VgrG, partial [Deltaproteobacteria bacterium]
DIFEDVLKKDKYQKDFQDYDIKKMQKAHPKREYCLQYRETDFDFLSRLLEEEGIYYFFKHEDGNHTMILSDDPGDNLKCENQETAKYKVAAGGWLDEDVITSLERTKEIRVGKYTLNDYDFRNPPSPLLYDVPTKYELDPKPAKREVYDFSGRYVGDISDKGMLKRRPEAERITKIRMEEEETQITKITGASVCRAFTSGYRFMLKEFRDDMDNKEYVLTEIVHNAEHVAEYTEKSVPDEKPVFAYTNRFTCIPHEVPFRPPRVTPKPIVYGSETAIVVGPKSLKSYTDPDETHPEHYGLVKIQFHWDRDGQKDDKSSCWVRVAYPYAGEKHGAQFTPLIGDEVIVDFLQGDPDKPVVTGSLFKGQHQSLIEQKKMIKNEILTPYGHRLHFDDKGGHITLNTGGGETINMADGKKEKTDYGNNIKISTADGQFIHLYEGLKGRGVKISTLMQHKFVMDDGVDGISIKIEDQSKKMSITLDSTAQEMTVENKGTGKLVLKAQGEIWIQSNTKILMEAPDIQIIGKGYVKVESTGANDVKGNPVKLNC